MTETRRVHVKFTPELLARTVAQAETEGITLGRLVRRAVTEYLHTRRAA